MFFSPRGCVFIIPCEEAPPREYLSPPRICGRAQHTPPLLWGGGPHPPPLKNGLPPRFARPGFSPLFPPFGPKKPPGCAKIPPKPRGIWGPWAFKIGLGLVFPGKLPGFGLTQVPNPSGFLFSILKSAGFLAFPRVISRLFEFFQSRCLLSVAIMLPGCLSSSLFLTIIIRVCQKYAVQTNPNIPPLPASGSRKQLSNKQLLTWLENISTFHLN